MKTEKGLRLLLLLFLLLFRFTEGGLCFDPVRRPKVVPLDVGDPQSTVPHNAFHITVPPTAPSFGMALGVTIQYVVEPLMLAAAVFQQDDLSVVLAGVAEGLEKADRRVMRAQSHALHDSIEPLPRCGTHLLRSVLSDELHILKFGVFLCGRCQFAGASQGITTDVLWKALLAICNMGELVSTNVIELMFFSL